MRHVGARKSNTRRSCSVDLIRQKDGGIVAWTYVFDMRYIAFTCTNECCDEQQGILMLYLIMQGKYNYA